MTKLQVMCNIFILQSRSRRGMILYTYPLVLYY